MKLLVVSVGHKTPDWIATGFSEYTKRMPREAQVQLIEIKPEPRSTGKSVGQIMEAEAQRIHASLPQNCYRIAMDEHGIQSTTRDLAARMKDWMQRGQDVAFIIGGADGLHESVKASAQLLLALSALTLPHAFVRVLLAEQLYRSHSLLHNHPYHRE